MTIISEVDELHSRAIAAVRVQVGYGFLAASDFSKPFRCGVFLLTGLFRRAISVFSFLLISLASFEPCLQLSERPRQKRSVNRGSESSRDTFSSIRVR